MLRDHGTPLAIAATLVLTASLLAEPPRYDRDIRPILSDRCFQCHGPDAAARQAGLRLDTRDGAVGSDGGGVVTPGDAPASELWRRVTSRDPAYAMPPPGSNKRALSPHEQQLLRAWIEAGAVYEPHWSFVPPTRPPVPAVHDAAAMENPIDRFIVAHLERQGLSLSRPADGATLVRRLFLDLTGLPPTPDEIDAFLADQRPGAYDRWIDKLLVEDPYRNRLAERLAVPWLDAARYADTCGIHMDAGRQMWAYRDWVLHAFRENMPFDRFLTHQLAGDLLPEATDAQKIATGFLRSHVTSDEGGAIAEEYLVEYAVERAATTGSVFLGLTVGCARCHEHKYDPISHEEFYRFYAFFNSVDEPGVYSQLPDPQRAFEPFMQVPTPGQTRQMEALRRDREAARATLEAIDPQERAQLEAFVRDIPTRAGVSWAESSVVSAESSGGAVLTAQPDGSVLASGPNPAKDDHTVTLRTHGRDLRLLCLEALTDPSLANGRVGRAFNGNAVLTGVEIEAVSILDPTKRETIPLQWAWADVEQANGDYRVTNVLRSDDLGWAVDGHRRDGPRLALLLTERPFGFDGGTDVRVTLRYRSMYANHALGRVRLRVGTIGDAGLARLPTATSGWYLVGPFPLDPTNPPYETAFEPEQDAVIDLTRNFGNGNQMWKFVEDFLDDKVNRLPDGRNITYVARRIYAPTPRTIEVSLGSDDGFELLLNGTRVTARAVERGVAPDQDKAALALRAGTNVVVLKVVNTGGLGGFYYRPLPVGDELAGGLPAALAPPAARWRELEQEIERSWKLAFSPAYRERQQALAAIERAIAELDAAIPKTMIMQELPQPRETFVLLRGQYDRPDRTRPVARGVPAALGTLPPDVPPNRLGLAQWMTAPDNPLVARVAVNRLWEMLFGSGLVRTSDDFGMQGEWPSHPELLDWLAIEFRESGWDVRHVLRCILRSRTYRQDSTLRPEALARDPDNRWLSYFPRRRLAAESIRDLALHVSGLLVEEFGGPSVKPYQPDGLWQEIAMPQSNTRVYERDAGKGLWRRSLYTYWKRACPPPSLLTFDAPTREACVIRRVSTNTPLQALTLWNDEQFVEAARVLAQRAIALRPPTSERSDGARLIWMFRACTGRTPQAEELGRIEEALAQFRRRYADAPSDAERLTAVGAWPRTAEPAAPELAAWTMIASSLLNLSETLTQR